MTYDVYMHFPVLAIMIPLLCCLLGSLLMGLLYSFLTVTLKANQNVVGLAMTTFGVGFGNFFGGSLSRLVSFFSEQKAISLEETDAILRMLQNDTSQDDTKQ